MSSKKTTQRRKTRPQRRKRFTTRCLWFIVTLLIIIILWASWETAASSVSSSGGFLERHILSLVSLPNIVAGAVIALLFMALVNFVLASWFRAMKFGLVLALLAALFLMAGCTGEQEFSFALGHKPRQNILKITGTGGKTYELILNDEIPTKNLIAIQTALSNTLVLETEIVTQAGLKAERKANQKQTLNIFYAVIMAAIMVTGAVCFTVIVVVVGGRKS